MKKIMTLILAVMLLPACSTNLTQSQPQTPNETLAASYITYTAVENTIADLLISRAITPSQAVAAKEKLQTVRKTLDHAKALIDANLALPDTTLEAIQQSQKILLQLQSDLKGNAP